MERFNKINWNVHPKRSQSLEFGNQEAFEKYSATYNILHDNFLCPWGYDAEPEVDNLKEIATVSTQQNERGRGRGARGRGNQNHEAGRGRSCWVSNETKQSFSRGRGFRRGGHVKKEDLAASDLATFKLPARYPKKSSLTAEEQKLYVQLHPKMGGRNRGISISAHTKEDLQKYEELKPRVTEEQNEFIQFASLVSQTTAQERFADIPSAIGEYTAEALKHRLKRVQEYPQWYSYLKELPLISSEDTSHIDMLEEGTVLELGFIPLISSPSYKPKINIPIDIGRVSRVYPPDCRLPLDVDSSKPLLHKLPVSCDPNFFRLCDWYQPDIVISTSGLKTLADNHPPSFDREWFLPVSVKEMPYKDGVEIKKKKVVFVDKPLPRRKMTMLEKTQWFYKYAVKTLLCQPKSPYSIVLEDTVRGPAKQVSYDDLDEEDYNLEDLELFGNEVSFKSPPKKESVVKLETPKSEKPAAKFGTEMAVKAVVNSSCQQDSTLLQKEENKKGGNVCLSDDSDDVDSPDRLFIDLGSPRAQSPRNENDEDKNVTLKKSHSAGATEVHKQNTDITYDSHSPEPTSDQVLPLEKCITPPRTVSTVTSKDVSPAASTPTPQEKSSQERHSCTRITGGPILRERRGKKHSPCICCTTSAVENKPPPIPRSSKKSGKGYEATSNSDTKQGDILQNLLSKQEELLKTLPKKSPEAKFNQRKMKPEDEKILSLPPHNNVTYRMWRMKKEERSLRIMVRSRIDGCMSKYQRKKYFYTVVAKPESLPAYGTETFTKSDACRQYISALLKPRSKILRVHFSMFTGEIIDERELGLYDIAEEGINFANWSAETSFNCIYSVLNSLTDLPVANYVLVHKTDSGASVTLWQEISDDHLNQKDITKLRAMNLHSAFCVNPAEIDLLDLKTLPLINPAEYLMPHFVRGRIPATFPPKVKPEFVATQDTKNKKKKRNRKAKQDK